MEELEANIKSFFQMKWKLLGERNQQIWNNFLDTIGDDPSILWVVGTVLLVLITYWSYALIFTIFDFVKPNWIIKYKIQQNQNQPISKSKLWKTIKQVIFNQTVVTGVSLYITNRIFFRSWTKQFVRKLPTMRTFLSHIVLMSILEEPLSYYTHLVLHHRSFYRDIHKIHHEWATPIAIMTFYCHPMEHIIRNFVPIAMLTILLKTHIVVTWAFTVLAILKAITDHCGYCFPFPFPKDSVLFHDYHHAKCKHNYGVFGWLDKLHSTYREKIADGSNIRSRKPANKIKSRKR